uniref:Uncharacterized protein n=1 Tax=Anabas testudineus TaxID=64144 RepID=A0A3Q1HL05_ANATE
MALEGDPVTLSCNYSGSKTHCFLPPTVQHVQHGTVQHGTVQHGTVQHGTVQHGTVQHGTVQHGTVQHGTVQHGTVQHGTVHTDNTWWSKGGVHVHSIMRASS